MLNNVFKGSVAHFQNIMGSGKAIKPLQLSNDSYSCLEEFFTFFFLFKASG